MIRFLLSSFIAIGLFSCAPKITKGLEKVPVTISEITNPYFADASQDYIYKAKLDIYGNYFGGILIIKKISEAKHRVVFTTEFGSKIFDFLYEDDTFTKNFVLPDLDKKIIVNTLEKDFRVLISETVKIEKQYTASNHDVYWTDKTVGGNVYFVNKISKQLHSIKHAPNGRSKIVFKFDEIEQNIARQIAINHNNIKLSIVLEYFKK